MFDTAGQAAAQGGTDIWGVAIRDTWSAMGAIMLPIYFVSFLAIFLGSIMSNKGIVIAFEQIKPDLKKIHPAEGFKKIFSVKNFVEFLKALVKSLLLLVSLGFAGYFGFRAMMQTPLCESNCGDEVLVMVAIPLVFGALALFILSALVDVSLQKWIFTREMRMTHTEMKREMKEIYGDPMVRRARNEIKRGIATDTDSGKASGYINSRVPTVVICSGNQAAIALRYVAGETPAPILLAKATGARASMLIASAVNSGIHVANDPETASALLQQGRIDGFVPESLFRDVARVMNSA
jgi:type III secretion protein U